MKPTILIFTALALGLGACATVSEETCIAGSWEALGYKDGRNGQSRGRFADIAETCTKYGITANATQYRLGYDRGLPLYCSYDNGYRRGGEGQSPKPECLDIGADSYVAGHADGYDDYLLRSEYDGLIDAYDDTRAALADVGLRLEDELLPADERKRLAKKHRRLERELDETRIDIRAFERVEGWPRRKLS